MAHYFIRFVDEKGKLRRCFTQNIDSLEYVANIDPEKLVTAHGSHHTSTCMNCRQVYDLDWITEKLAHKDWKILKCETCGGVVKPNIVFFGEALPARFFNCCSSDLPVCDLLIIMGTSLVVHPFASMIYEVADDVPRLLINMTDAGKGGLYERAMGLPNLRYDEVGNYRDVFWRGSCDDGVALLADLMGWKHELNKLVQNEWNKLDIKFAKLKKRASDQSRTTDFDSKSS
ncbi:hypothetical protein AB6A40_008434 [Gnathostoma spinigerum]|uniref:Deacetylase sirtuin-type domain-containing protein n=1 Tax=Gnathostoma spinigerum TaxID=75299 RepID=A0ABD6EP25_9BILA